MGRWRPPTEGSTALITRAGFEQLKRELDQLWRVERPEVVKALAAAAAEGDRSENAEYAARKKQLAGIDRRVRYLGKRIPALRVVEQPPSAPQRIYFTAEIRLEDAESGEVLEYRIVGPDETEARRGWISIDSPLARALLGRTLDDTVTVDLPAGRRTLVVLGVSYSRLDASRSID